MKRKITIGLLLLSVLFLFVACFSNSPGVPGHERYSIYVNIIGEGIVEPSNSYFPANTIITFLIQPASGWEFDRWEGQSKYDVQQGANSWQITMNSNKNLTAIFKQTDGGTPGKDYSLNVSVMGKGNVTPNSGNYNADEVVTLTVRPDNGWAFVSWEGPNKYEVYGSNNSYFINMNSNKTLIAVFQEDTCPLNITVIGNGRVEERLMGADYAKGSLVRLTAIADSGWLFKEWRGDASGKDEVVYVEIEKNTAIVAVFEKKVSNFTLNIEVQGKGTVDEKLIGANEYEDGSIVQLVAKPNNGWKFKEWLGDLRGTNRQASIEMDSNKNVTAVFVQEVAYYLYVNVKGNGTVTKSPDSDNYEDGEIVTLTAEPAKGWEFIRWSGDVSSTRNSVNVTMDSDKEVTAIFEREAETFTLDVQITGNGKVTKSPDKDEYYEGDRVTLTADADSGWEFKGWSGDASGTGSQVRVTMDGNKRVTATFEKVVKRYRLNINVVGSGTVNKSPDSGDYEEGTRVTLSASPSAGWGFQGWSGDTSGSGNLTEVIMDRDKNVTATFIAQQGEYTLTLSFTPIYAKGSVSKSPDLPKYKAGDVVTITAAQLDWMWEPAYWEVNGQRMDGISHKITITKDTKAVAVYELGGN